MLRFFGDFRGSGVWNFLVIPVFPGFRGLEFSCDSCGSGIFVVSGVSVFLFGHSNPRTPRTPETLTGNRANRGPAAPREVCTGQVESHSVFRVFRPPSG
jgi:hypothetical protein